MKYSCIIKTYGSFIKTQERLKTIDFLQSLVKDLELFNDKAEDYKAIIAILESEDWVRG